MTDLTETAEGIVEQSREQLVRDLLEQGLKLLEATAEATDGDPQRLTAGDLVHLSAEVRGYVMRALGHHERENLETIKTLKFNGEYRENKILMLKKDKENLRRQLATERGKRTTKTKAIKTNTAKLEASLDLRTRELITAKATVDGLYTAVRYLAERLGEAEA